MNEDKELTEEIKKLNQTLRSQRGFSGYVFYFFSSIISGLGWVVGATVMVTIFVFILSQLQALPYIGKIIDFIITNIKKGY